MTRYKKLTTEILDKLIKEELDKHRSRPQDHPKYIEVEPNRDTSKLVGVQRKYMEFINELTPEERQQMKDLFCYDMFSIEKINQLALASKGKIDG